MLSEVIDCRKILRHLVKRSAVNNLRVFSGLNAVLRGFRAMSQLSGYPKLLVGVTPTRIIARERQVSDKLLPDPPHQANGRKGRNLKKD